MKKSLKYIMIIQVLILFSYALNAQDEFPGNGDNVKIYSMNVELPILYKGAFINNFMDEQYIIFEIVTKKGHDIEICKLNELSNEYFEFDDEWRVGSYTGYEEEYIDCGRYSPVNNKFYVSVKIKSVKVSNSIPSGIYTLKQGISVRYIKKQYEIVNVQ